MGERSTCLVGKPRVLVLVGRLDHERVAVGNRAVEVDLKGAQAHRRSDEEEVVGAEGRGRPP